MDKRFSVDYDAMYREKEKWYVKTMQKRGLDPEISNQAYLAWWADQLGVQVPVGD